MVISAVAAAKKKDPPPPPPQPIVILWPAPDNATIKLTFSPFRQVAAYQGQMTLVSDVVILNLSAKVVPRATFTVSLLDENKVRLGNGVLLIDDLSPGEAAKVLFQCSSVGPPRVLSIVARNSGGIPTSTKTIPFTINSVPPGAAVKVDDKDSGTTPATVRLIAGSHSLELQKDGYATAKAPLDIAADEAPGGSMTITLGGLANDTVELRDGSILMGDVISMTLESVVIKVNGQDQTFDRNKIRKMFLVERITTHTVTGPDTQVKQPATPNVQVPHR